LPLSAITLRDRLGCLREKALGDAGELSWWEARAADAAARQHIPILGL